MLKAVFRYVPLVPLLLAVLLFALLPFDRRGVEPGDAVGAVLVQDQIRNEGRIFRSEGRVRQAASPSPAA